MLRLSTRVRYGTRILVRLAVEDRPLSRREIAQAEGMTKPYVFNTVKVLRSAGMVGSGLGRNGGYFLAKPAHTIRLADIYEVMEGPVCLAPCDDDCEKRPECTVQAVWQAVSTAIQDEMMKHTVADMAEKLKRHRQ